MNYVSGCNKRSCKINDIFNESDSSLGQVALNLAFSALLLKQLKMRIRLRKELILRAIGMTQHFKTSPTISSVIALFLLVWTLFAIAPGYSLAATYYVDQNNPQASDSNPGTELLPWKTPYKIKTVTLSPGDTVYIKAGTYDVSTEPATWECAAIHPKNSGLPGNPITIAAFPGDTVILDGKSILGHAQIGTCSSALTNYITIDGFTVINAGDVGILAMGVSRDSKVIGVVIKNNNISGLYRPDGDNTDGIRVVYTSGTVIRNNLTHNVHNGGANETNASGIKMYTNDHVLIENNEIYDAFTCIFDKAEGEFNTYHRNLLHDCYFSIHTQSNGFPVYAHDNRSYENIMYNVVHGVSFDAADNHPEYNISVYNNTIVGHKDGIEIPNNGSNIKLYNNILVDRSGSGPEYADFFTYNDPPSLITLSDYNLVYPNIRLIIGLYSTNRIFTSLSSWQSYSGWDAHSLVADPIFVNATARDYHPASGSPALNAGRIGGVSTGAIVNIGAYTTGTEVIGLTTSFDHTAPAPPTGLTVR